MKKFYLKNKCLFAVLRMGVVETIAIALAVVTSILIRIRGRKGTEHECFAAEGAALNRLKLVVEAVVIAVLVGVVVGEDREA